MVHDGHFALQRLGQIDARLVTHVRLLETDSRLVLVDNGFGTHDWQDPASRTGPVRFLIRPPLHLHETALHQVKKLGFQGEDVRHIVITHLDSDHIGGLSDFPNANVHLTVAEALGGFEAPSQRERFGFNSAQWAHRPKIVEYSAGGESWRGFAAARELTEIAPGIVLVPMPGHTRGRTAGTFDRRQVRAKHERLAELYTRRDPDLLIACSHDPERSPSHARLPDCCGTSAVSAMSGSSC
ncbi:glyoxylase-like metal-dependent hydrolase (beta-lactamase superfamily II) [Mycobacterium frederiksbergense]|uniref:Glyoxylase-like metal-dependent hydrolase (Beta-lactamase superfamily II) n=1 Tax=Mycolicibacterium frederiksbergense TaxID=117567 RepID=A0ABT6KUY4_9MYCO|nr:MBL fold metallo-hydrolase [Mycolicibacterium frederiksbergense]MDH6194056.1 glyoxylase-like metal-dependent hydrolase (beta-lactamase superfamily II) [Mycolicibacterium frederiksbergense]